jgi:hypothetical protein
MEEGGRIRHAIMKGGRDRLVAFMWRPLVKDA